MLDILTIIHSFADTQTASRIRRTCRRLGALIPQPVLHIDPDYDKNYEYRVGGKLHRPDGPAIGYIGGNVSWYRAGISHREYHPQYISRYHISYEVNGLIHREAGPSAIYDNSNNWYVRGQLHRKTGPAYNWIGKKWYTRGKLHRLDGPALLYVSGELYYIRGISHRISAPMDSKWIVNRMVIRI